MRRALLIATIAVSCSLVASQDPTTTIAPDPCAQWPTCDDCLAHNLCGWCSEPVVYPNNVTGKQCAGFNPSGPDPFACNGIYSTDTCFAGYICNPINWTCDITTPGNGVPLETCEQNCQNSANVYLCNTSSKQCYVVPPGTPGSSSLSVCEQSCSHPSPHPVPPPPPSPPSSVYACNYTTGQCNPAPAGKGSSLPVCEAACQKENGTQYICNTFLQKCVKVPPAFPHAMPLAKCEAVCEPHPQPGPPPAWLGGMWRGIEIQNDYKIGEWDFNVQQTSVTIVDITSATTIKGIPFNVKHGSSLALWVNVTSGPGTGQVIKLFGEQDQRGPETNFLTASMSVPGGSLPETILAAMTAGGGVKVFGLAQCAGTPECVFTMPSSMSKGQLAQRLRRDEKKMPGKHTVGGRLEHIPRHPQGRRLLEEEVDSTPTDPCTQWGSSCQLCLQHPLCGWCSENVTYKGGVQGNQCAGFSTNANTSNPFVCRGRYSTLSCNIGYDCTTTGQCVPDPTPGNGLPLNVCQQICRPTQTPAPIPPQWVCNVTTKQCYHCNQTFCPGAMPKATCEASCVKPKPGPTALTKGMWRGIKIQNNYPLGEYDMWINASAVTFYKGATAEWSGTIESYGGDVIVFNIESGANAGKQVSAIYTVADQGNTLYEWMTIAFGVVGGSVPQSYATPMQTPPEYELVMAKCAGPPCTFHRPS